MMRNRLARLEKQGRERGQRRISVVWLDLLGGEPDMVTEDGQLRPCGDGRRLLRELQGEPVKVYCGIDPRLV
jgi:hypothetical protein